MTGGLNLQSNHPRHWEYGWLRSGVLASLALLASCSPDDGHSSAEGATPSPGGLSAGSNRASDSYSNILREDYVGP